MEGNNTDDILKEETPTPTPSEVPNNIGDNINEPSDNFIPAEAYEEIMNEPKEQSSNFSPTEAYQYQETKSVEPDLPVNVNEFNSQLQEEDQPHIVDETDALISDSTIPGQIRPTTEDDSTITYEVNPDAPNTQNNGNVNDPNLDAEFYQHSLQYLVQNLNNLRDTLQNIITSNEINNNIGGMNQGVNNMNQANENNLQAGILNNENQITDQLLNLRRILSGNVDNTFRNDAFGWNNNGLGNQPAPDLQINQNTLVNRITNWSNNLDASVRQFITTIPKDANTFSWIIFFFSIALCIIGFSTVPDLQQKDLIYFIDWLAYHKSSRFFLLSITLLYISITFKLSHLIYHTFAADRGENFYKTAFDSLRKYSPFYDNALYIFLESSIVQNKFEYFFFGIMMIWYIASTKIVGLLHNKLNQVAVSINHNSSNTYSKMRRIQLVAAIYLAINLQVAYVSVWLAWDTPYLIVFVVAALSLLAIIEPLKVFLSGSILIKNYSLVTNNNSRELSDPKFKVELLIDLIYQFVVMLLIAVLGIASAKQFSGLLAIHWLSLTNSIEKLKSCYNKYLHWIKLQKRLNELFPIVERSSEAPEELCSICHENLLIARRLPCGHTFHLKCLIYWLENQKTCPNCRADVSNLNDIVQNNGQEGSRHLLQSEDYSIKSLEYFVRSLHVNRSPSINVKE